METVNIWVVVIPSLIAAIPGVLALIQQGKKIRQEQPIDDADAAQKYMETAKQAQEYIAQKDKQIGDLLKRVGDLEEEVKKLKSELKIRDNEIKRLREKYEPI